jgi:hypothetical protein
MEVAYKGKGNEWKCDLEEFEPTIPMNAQIGKLLLVKKKHGM